MRVVIQRVLEASVSVNKQITSAIGNGLLVFVGIESEDNSEDIDWLVRKIINMRIFEDEEGVMNKSLLELKKEILLVSQFTLHASTKKGNRPSYIKAAKPDFANKMYEEFIVALDNQLGKKIATGTFGADMKVALINDGPITITIDSKAKE